ncbi:delta-60 repeat domain-containing protein [Patescibacteria group bacterium]
MKRKIMMIRVKDLEIEIPAIQEPDWSKLPDFVGECDFNNQVYCIIQIQGGKILIGGRFTKFKDREVGCLVCLSSDGSVDEEFMDSIGRGATDWVWCVTQIQNGKILIGGRFTRFKNREIGCLICLNLDETADLKNVKQDSDSDLPF